VVDNRAILAPDNDTNFKLDFGPEEPIGDINVFEFDDIDPMPKRRKKSKSFSIGGITVKADQKFEADILFSPADDTIIGSESTGKILNDLVKTLKAYPQMIVIIKGNLSYNPSRRATHGNTNTSTIGNFVDGRMSIGAFQLTRARAILNFLTGKGINPSRVKTSTGEVRFEGQSGRTTSITIK